jgi:hypothetical protein
MPSSNAPTPASTHAATSQATSSPPTVSQVACRASGADVVRHRPIHNPHKIAATLAGRRTATSAAYAERKPLAPSLMGHLR